MEEQGQSITPASSSSLSVSLSLSLSLSSHNNDGKTKGGVGNTSSRSDGDGDGDGSTKTKTKKMKKTKEMKMKKTKKKKSKKDNESIQEIPMSLPTASSANHGYGSADTTTSGAPTAVETTLLPSSITSTLSVATSPTCYPVAVAVPDVYKLPPSLLLSMQEKEEEEEGHDDDLSNNNHNIIMKIPRTLESIEMATQVERIKEPSASALSSSSSSSSSPSRNIEERPSIRRRRSDAAHPHPHPHSHREPSLISVRFYKTNTPLRTKNHSDDKTSSAFGLYFIRKGGQLYIKSIRKYYDVAVPDTDAAAAARSDEDEQEIADPESGEGGGGGTTTGITKTTTTTTTTTTATPFLLPPFQKDDLVLWADSHPCANWSPKAIRQYIQTTPSVYVTLTVRRPHGDPNLALAVFFKQPNGNGNHNNNNMKNNNSTMEEPLLRMLRFQTDKFRRLYIHWDLFLRRNVLLRQAMASVLQNGDLVQSINGIDTTSTSTTITATLSNDEQQQQQGPPPFHPNVASSLVQSATHQVSILVQKQDEVDVTLRNFHSMTDSSSSSSNNNNRDNTERSWVHALADFASQLLPSHLSTLVAVQVEEDLLDRPPDGAVVRELSDSTNEPVSHPIPGFVSVQTFRPTKDARSSNIGLSLSVLDGAIVISHIRKTGSLFSKTPLELSMQILSINQKHFSASHQLAEAIQELENTTGTLSILARNPNGNPNYCQAMAYKSSPRSEIGVSFARAEPSSDGSLFIRRILVDSIFATSTSVLKEGDTVLSINGLSCEYLRPTDAFRIVQQADTGIIITTRSYTRSAIVCSFQECGQSGRDRLVDLEAAGNTSSAGTHNNHCSTTFWFPCFSAHQTHEGVGEQQRPTLLSKFVSEGFVWLLWIGLLMMAIIGLVYILLPDDDNGGDQFQFSPSPAPTKCDDYSSLFDQDCTLLDFAGVLHANDQYGIGCHAIYLQTTTQSTNPSSWYYKFMPTCDDFCSEGISYSETRTIDISTTLIFYERSGWKYCGTDVVDPSSRYAKVHLVFDADDCVATMTSEVLWRGEYETIIRTPSCDALVRDLGLERIYY